MGSIAIQFRVLEKTWERKIRGMKKKKDIYIYIYIYISSFRRILEMGKEEEGGGGGEEDVFFCLKTTIVFGKSAGQL